jgi:hypothetical protein
VALHTSGLCSISDHTRTRTSAVTDGAFPDSLFHMKNVVTTNAVVDLLHVTH